MTKQSVFTILQKIILAIAAFFICAMFIAQLLHSSLISANAPAYFFNSLLAILAFSLIFIASKKRYSQFENPHFEKLKVRLASFLNSPKCFPVILAIIFLFSMFYCIVITPFPVQPDEGILLRTAHGGNDLIVNFNYVNFQNFQVFAMTVEHFVWKLSHSHQSVALVILSLINALSLLAIIFFSKLFIQKANPQIKQFSINIASLLIGFIAAPAVANMYPNLAFLAFCCAGLASFQMVLDVNSKKQFFALSVLTFALLSIAGLIRPNTAIFIAAIFLFALLSFLKTRNFKLIIIVILVILSSFTSSFLADFCVSSWAKQYGLQKSAQLDPLSTHVASGLNILKKTNPPGQYYEYTNPIHWANIPEVGIPPYSDSAAAEIKKQSWAIVRENVNYMLQNPFDALSFFAQKFVGSNSKEDFSYYSGAIKGQPYLIGTKFIVEATEPLEKYLDSANPFVVSSRSGVIFSLIIVLMKLSVFTLLSLALICIFKLFRAVKNEEGSAKINTVLLPIIIFIGGECYNLISETKSAYILVWFILLLPLSALGANITDRSNKTDAVL